MSTTNLDNPVFPVPTGGLSKRELFAAMAMQGILAADSEDNVSFEALVKVSVRSADALLVALAQTPPPGSLALAILPFPTVDASPTTTTRAP